VSRARGVGPECWRFVAFLAGRHPCPEASQDCLPVGGDTSPDLFGSAGELAPRTGTETGPGTRLRRRPVSGQALRLQGSV
jgi:hypothetical protein